jgi:hypothetical protein
MDWGRHLNEGRLPRIGGMATMPSRAHTFRAALDTILPQVDRLFVFFDKLDRVPEFVAGIPQIVPLLPAQHGPLGADGKLMGALLTQSPCLYFCFDDDIRYPLGHVELLASALERHRFDAVVGFHACWFLPPFLSYRENRGVLHFSWALRADALVDELGAGTMAFHNGRFRVDPRSWRYHTMGDLMSALEAARLGLPRVAVRRPKDFLTPLEELQEDSLFRRLIKDDTTETTVMRHAMDQFPGSWTAAVTMLNP